MIDPAGEPGAAARKAGPPLTSHAVVRGPRVLVSAASRHGASREIAAAVSRWLPETPAGRSAGLTITFPPVEQHPDPARFDAVAFGSAVYARRWLEATGQWVTTSAAALRRSVDAPPGFFLGPAQAEGRLA